MARTNTTRKAGKRTTLASLLLRKTSAFSAMLGLLLAGGLWSPPAASADALSDAKAVLAAAQKELNSANAALTQANNAFAGVKASKQKIDTVNSQANSANGIVNDVVFPGQTPLYVQVNGQASRPDNPSTLVAVRGQYVTSQGDWNKQGLLNYINQVRYDAYKEGLATKYVALQWSNALERTAQIRAAEISIYGDHMRPSGEKWHGLGNEGLQQPYGENLSWGANYYYNVKMWVDEKADYIKYKQGKAAGQWGHYSNLINMGFTQIGIAHFVTDRSTVNPYGTAMAAELAYNVSSAGSADVKPAGTTVYQGVFVRNGSLGAIGANGAATFNPRAVSGDPVFYCSSTVNEAKALAKAMAGVEWNRIAADYNAKQNVVNTAQAAVNAANAKVNAAQQKVNALQPATVQSAPKTTTQSTVAAQPRAAATQASTGGTQQMFRMYNRISHEHFYTADTNERDVLRKGDWTYEGVGWVAPKRSNTPVYRLYNPVLGDHHYTTDKNEVGVLTKSCGWKSEGIGWYSSDQKEVKVYRQFNPSLTVGSHNYTTDLNEYNVNNQRNGWKGEGIAWYAVQKGWSI